MDLFIILAEAVSCDGTDIAGEIVGVLRGIKTLIQIIIPIGLIIWGMLDLGKAIFQQKDEDIKKAQTTFMKRLIAAVLLFLLIPIVLFILNILGVGETSCINEIFNN